VSSTIPFPTKLKEAQLVITALGQAQIFSGGMFAENAVVIDISTNRLPNGTTVGDVEAGTVLETQYVSPVPGGVGPLTIAFLLKNVVDAAAHTIPSGS
jgi:methylenetetrahydrofolate dehydrogenase (NADP+)/methenyltetrahydrofolate cyclohydrolase